MAIAATFEKQVGLGGGLKMVIFRLVQTGATAGTINLSSYFNHIYWADVRDISTDVGVNVTWN